MSEPLEDLTYWVDPPNPVARFFSTFGAWEGNVLWIIGDQRIVVPTVLISDGEGHGFGITRGTGDSDE